MTQWSVKQANVPTFLSSCMLLSGTLSSLTSTAGLVAIMLDWAHDVFSASGIGDFSFVLGGLISCNTIIISSSTQSIVSRSYSENHVPITWQISWAHVPQKSPKIYKSASPSLTQSFKLHMCTVYCFVVVENFTTVSVSSVTALWCLISSKHSTKIPYMAKLF